MKTPEQTQTRRGAQRSAENEFIWGKETFNIQHSTSNIQCRTFGHSFDVRRSMLNVERSQFPLRASLRSPRLCVSTPLPYEA